MDNLKTEVSELKNKVNFLEKQIKNLSFLQEEFTKQKVFRRDVIFKNPVYDKNGTKVIN